MKILLLAEHDNNQLKEATYHAVSAAQKFQAELYILVAGLDCESVAQQASSIEGVHKVLWVDASCYQHPMAEVLSELILELSGDFQLFLAAATTFGKNIMPRVAARLDVAQISDVSNVISNDTFERPIYAGNAIQTVRSLDPIKVLTVRTTAFSAATTNAQASIERLELAMQINAPKFIRHELTQSERPELTSAKRVVSGGRGLQNKENFDLIEKLAETLDAAVGASRAAVDAGFVPNDYQVGQTGKVIAPELYIAVGISGAIQHIAGMKDSKVIVAINKDEEAPIFQIADYGLVGDLFEVVPELISELSMV